MTNDSVSARQFPLVGLALVFAGLLALLHSSGISADWLRFWPLGLVGFGLVKLLDPRTERERIAGILLSGAGALLLAANLTLGRYGLRHFWPLVLIVLGAALVWEAIGAHATSERNGHVR